MSSNPKLITDQIRKIKAEREREREYQKRRNWFLVFIVIIKIVNFRREMLKARNQKPSLCIHFLKSSSIEPRKV